MQVGTLCRRAGGLAVIFLLAFCIVLPNYAFELTDNQEYGLRDLEIFLSMATILYPLGK